jgi:hypothetical protein
VISSYTVLAVHNYDKYGSCEIRYFTLLIDFPLEKGIKINYPLASNLELILINRVRYDSCSILDAISYQPDPSKWVNITHKHNSLKRSSSNGSVTITGNASGTVIVTGNNTSW